MSARYGNRRNGFDHGLATADRDACRMIHGHWGLPLAGSGVGDEQLVAWPNLDSACPASQQDCTQERLQLLDLPPRGRPLGAWRQPLCPLQQVEQQQQQLLHVLFAHAKDAAPAAFMVRLETERSAFPSIRIPFSARAIRSG